ncbi:phosphatase PAP2 family protein [Salinarchaeum sp. IM2453]|uniref:phosphatase PAP2 family protein n=1 Tax=Salinarchaeum sp. IM2453 TaxID=2862870 RepID=UPI001C82E692|nr:phosphatase PAP2 family protein [Salinarchaeum sp. IM2453]QZA87851.1 phosphatase PAP2 family protein [Salinarchaeum sp. IM2453]
MLRALLVNVSAVVAVMLIIMTAISVSKGQILSLRKDWKRRVKQTAPIAILLVGILLFNSFARDRVFAVSRRIGWRPIGPISDYEETIILAIQDVVIHELTVYFSFIYVYGYAFMLIFPVIAYLVLTDTIHLRKLLTAYSVNYMVGIVFYTLVLLYGPRNTFTDLVTLYEFQPEMQYITREVNDNTNVFPSLHTSLSATIAIFAYRTRDAYPVWNVVALILAASVAISTVYLAIHWVVDVIAGLILAWVSVLVADMTVDRFSVTRIVYNIFDKIRSTGSHLRGKIYSVWDTLRSKAQKVRSKVETQKE